MTIPKFHYDTIKSALTIAGSESIDEKHIIKMTELCINIANYLDSLQDISLQFVLVQSIVDFFNMTQQKIITGIYTNKDNLKKDYKTVLTHKERFN